MICSCLLRVVGLLSPVMVFGMLYLRKWLLIVAGGWQQKLQLHKLLRCSVTFFTHLRKRLFFLVETPPEITPGFRPYDFPTMSHYVTLSMIPCTWSYSSFHLQEAVQLKGLRDDTTCIVIDIVPPEKPTAPLPQPKKLGRGVFKSMFRRKSSESSSQIDKEYLEPDVVEELYEEGSAMLSERFVL